MPYCTTPCFSVYTELVTFGAPCQINVGPILTVHYEYRIVLARWSDTDTEPLVKFLRSSDSRNSD